MSRLRARWQPQATHRVEHQRLYRIGRKPGATVVRWHRQGWRWYWGRRMKRHPPGRPTIGWELFHLFRRLQKDNPTWGAPRITSELRLLGHTVGTAPIPLRRETTPPCSSERHPFSVACITSTAQSPESGTRRGGLKSG